EVSPPQPAVRSARSASERAGARRVQRRAQAARAASAAARPSRSEPLSAMRFDVIAVDARRQIVALELEAANAALAAEEVRSRGLSLISLEPRGVRLPLPRRQR